MSWRGVAAVCGFVEEHFGGRRISIIDIINFKLSETIASSRERGVRHFDERKEGIDNGGDGTCKGKSSSCLTKFVGKKKEEV